jgi:hypothetical protein
MIDLTKTLTRPLGLALSTAGQAIRLGQRAVSGAVGLVRGGGGGGEGGGDVPQPQTEQRQAQPKPGMDDNTLARKVETELFRSPRSPKATVDVNVVEGIVQLRGTVKTPNQIKTLEARARAIPEVRDVDNLLHLVRTDASTRTDTSSRARTEGPVPEKRTSRSTRARKAATRANTARKPRVVSNERKPDNVEPGADELAPRRRGRRPAPLGSTDPAPEAQGTQPPASGAGGGAGAGEGSPGAGTDPATGSTGTPGGSTPGSAS